MPKEPVHAPDKQIQLLESKLSKIRWVNGDLGRQVFEAIQRGHRLAAKLGYQDLDEAEFALSTQNAGSEERVSQLGQLSQYPSEELASHVQALQAELVSHVHLSKATLGALEDVTTEVALVTEENERLRKEVERLMAERKVKTEEGTKDKRGATSKELAYVRAKLAALKKQYSELLEAKQKAEDKHNQDYRQWRDYWKMLKGEEKREKEKEEERAAKRRKLNPKDDGRDNEKRDSKEFPEPKLRKIQRRLGAVPSYPGPGWTTPTRGSPEPEILAPRSLNSPSSTTALPLLSSKAPDVKVAPRKVVKQESVTYIPQAEGVPASSETEPDSGEQKYILPSHQNINEQPPSTVAKKRPHSPAPDRDSSETEIESQVKPDFLLPSQIEPASVTDMTPKPPPASARRVEQCPTPISVPRPQLLPKGKERRKIPAPSFPPPPSSLQRSDPFCPSPTLFGVRGRLPESPISSPSKGRERAVPNDENTPVSMKAGPSGSTEKKYPSDYSIYKGRGRYGAEAQAVKETTINAMFEIDPEQNGGVGYQYEEVVRDKEKRKQMHAGDCECCRNYYEAVGPLPHRQQGPMWRSPQSSPSKKRGSRDSFEEDGQAAIEEHKQAISRHRQHWERGPTPPGYWNIGFPDTQEVAQMNEEAKRMHARKEAVVADEAQRGGKYRRR